MSVEPADGGRARIRFEAPGSVEAILARRTLERWRAEPNSYLPASFLHGPLRQALRQWAEGEPNPGDDLGDYSIKRLALRAPDPRHAGLPWERAVAAAASWVTVVRVSRVRPDVLGIPLTFPLRLLQLEPDQSRVSVAAVVEGVLGSSSRRRELIAVAERPAAGLLGWRRRARWPTAEVVHLPMLLDQEAALRSASEEPGSLGWIERILGTWQTRLVVLECRTDSELAAARVLAITAADRGGPAAFVVDARDEEAAQSLHWRYSGLFHDQPLEMALPASWSLIGGAGREEALRVSRVGVDLIELRRRLARFRPKAKREDEPPVVGILVRGTSKPAAAGVRGLREAIGENIEKKWDDLTFEIHESEGTVPLALGVDAIRRAAGIRSPRHVIEDATPVPRYLNARLTRNGDDGSLELVPQAGPPLVAGEPYHLAVRIGPRDRDVYVAREEALLEEKFLWKPGDRGRWVEVSVSGLGFEVAGAAVRQLWLPRRGASLPVTYPVMAPRWGVACLRVCLYVDQNLVHALRVGARVAGPDGRGDPRAAELAEDLDLPVDEVRHSVWLPRCEYDLGGDYASHRERALSIVVNERDGRDRVTVKGEDVWIDVTADLTHLVEEVRDLLGEISTPGFKTKPERNWLYGFGLWGEHLNRGREESFGEQLQQLAAVGWRLYDLLVSAEQRARLGELLAADDQRIHVAQLLLEKVVPWAVIYDRKFSSRGRRTKDGKPVEHATCLAALPDAEGRMPGFDCGEHPSCLLHPDQAHKRQQAGAPAVIEETVACPRRFWGFRHQIELPPQQTDRAQQAPKLSPKVRNGRPTRIVFGGHGGLTKARDHLEALKGLLEKATVNGKVVAAEWDRDRVVDTLADPALDAVYLYCHAEGKRGTGKWPPVLRFGPDDASEGVVEAGDLDTAPWVNSPLVVINGCRSAAFAPDALSPFIRKLARDRKAGGLVGTEISVWEQLASEFGQQFLLAVLSGTSTCGMALLTARRRLLHKLNPLGLVYTLYADADLELAHKPTRT